MDQDRERVKAAFKNMTGKEKIRYILQSYWVCIVVGAIVLWIGISIIGKFTFNQPPEKCLQIGVRASRLDPPSIEELPDHLEERFPEMTEGGEKVFSSEQFFAGYRQIEAEEANAVMYKMAGCVAAGMLDVIVGDQETMVNDVSLNIYKDLRNVFTEEELEKIARLAKERAPEGEEGILYLDYAVTTTNGRTEEIIKDIPYLICVTGGDEGIDDCLAGDPVYLAIVNNAPNLDNVKALIWSLLGENGD